jgi:hypothetical protein
MTRHAAPCETCKPPRHEDDAVRALVRLLARQAAQEACRATLDLQQEPHDAEPRPEDA